MNNRPCVLARLSWPVVAVALGAPVLAAGWFGAHFRQVAQRVSSDAAAFDKFGWSVALSGDTAIASATEDDDNGADSGAAYVFARRTTGAKPWRETRKITPTDGAAGDQFGFATSISADTALISARGDDDNGVDAGSAYIFERDSGGAENWGGVKKLFASDPAAGDAFGWSVALDGDTAIVGSLFGSSATGSAYVFGRNKGGAGNWGLVQKLTSADAAAADRFGRSVSIDGDTIIVTSDGNDDMGSSSGSAYVFVRDAGGASNWGQVRKLTAADASAVDHFGISCAISGQAIVVGAHRDDDGGVESGSAYVFERDHGGANNWGQIAKLTASDAAPADSFGRAVAIRDNAIAVGAYAHEHAALGVRSGAVYVFERNEGGSANWGQTQELTGSNQAGEDVFGWSMVVGLGEVLVGAPHIDETFGAETGSLYAFASRPPKTQMVTQYMPRASALAFASSPSLLRAAIGGPGIAHDVTFELDCSGNAPGPCALVATDSRGATIFVELRMHDSGIEVFELALPDRVYAESFVFEVSGIILGATGPRTSERLLIDVQGGGG